MGFTFSNPTAHNSCDRLAIAASLLITTPVHAQGCIVARSNGEQGGPDSEGGYLMPESGISTSDTPSVLLYSLCRPTEQSYRVQDGTEVMNKSIWRTSPRLTNCRPVQPDGGPPAAYRKSPIEQFANYLHVRRHRRQFGWWRAGWIWNPKRNHRGNIQLGLGILLPTGKDDVANTVDPLNGKGTTTTVVDYSIHARAGRLGYSPAMVGL